MADTTKKWIIANWKMHGLSATARGLATAIARHAEKIPADINIVICPPSILLHPLAGEFKTGRVKLGGQDCHEKPEGAFTGNISAAMLKDAGCGYVIVGHSERRGLHGETNAHVLAKARVAQAAGLTPVICVGETLADREGGQAKKVVRTQVAESVPAEGSAIIAYEPVWAIGSGKTATREDIEAMHTYIMGLLGGKCPVIYGGSVKAANAREILHASNVHGVLVGGASLNAEEFCNIIDAAE